MTQAPDLIDPVVGFRKWRLTGDKLSSPLVPVPWSRRVMEARCYWSPLLGEQERVERAHLSPHPTCKCGIYAGYELRRRTPPVYDGCVFGIVTVWGRIELHRGGMRAQHARVEALGFSPEWGLRHRRAVERAGAGLGVDVVDYGSLNGAAESYGSPLPAHLIPASATQEVRAEA